MLFQRLYPFFDVLCAVPPFHFGPQFDCVTAETLHHRSLENYFEHSFCKQSKMEMKDLAVLFLLTVSFIRFSNLVI